MRSRSKHSERGAVAIQVIAILVPVVFGLMGFAVDLGMIYAIKGELKTAANSMALAQAANLIGTDTGLDTASTAGQITVDNSDSFGNRFYFHGYAIGQTTGSLESVISQPAYYANVADALASPTPSGSEVSGSTARHVRVSLTAQARLLFWSFLPVATNRTVTIAVSSVAGMSSPLCQACGIEPLGVGAVDATDTVDFGFIPGTKYTLAFLCNAPGAIAALPGTNGVQRYLVLNRLDSNTTNFPDETSQAYRDGAGGLVGTTTATQSCFLINATETIWASATPSACNAARLPAVTGSVLCGFATRFDSNLATTCASTVVSVDSLTPAYTQDTDVNDVDNYTDYVGNGRRLITVPIVDALSATGTMTVLGFRQFLILPTQGSTNIVPGDTNGRFPAMYVGTVAPLKQGRFDGCQITNGPGKVVLHQ